MAANKRQSPELTAGPLTTVGVRELRGDLASMIRRANAGERIVVTVDGQPAAVLGPPSPSPDVSLETLFAAGLATPPTRQQPARAPSPVAPAVDIRIDDTIGELRGR